MKIINSGTRIGAAVLMGLMVAAGSAQAQVFLTSGNLQGWYFGATDGNGDPTNADPGDVAQIVAAPATPPVGGASVELATGTGAGDNGVFLSTDSLDGLPLVDLTLFSYSTYVTQNNGQQFPYLQIGISTTGTGPADDTLFFEPPYQTASTGNASLPDQGATALDTWQTWNATEGGFWDNSGTFTPGTGVGSLAAFLALNPNATIEPAYTSGNQTIIGGVALTVGYGGSGETETAFVDNITIGTTTGTVTFDAETPEPSTWAMLVMGLGLLSLQAVRRRGRLAPMLKNPAKS
jgi:hypothetical protein